MATTGYVIGPSPQYKSAVKAEPDVAFPDNPTNPDLDKILKLIDGLDQDDIIDLTHYCANRLRDENPWSEMLTNTTDSIIANCNVLRLNARDSPESANYSNSWRPIGPPNNSMVSPRSRPSTLLSSGSKPGVASSGSQALKPVPSKLTKKASRTAIKTREEKHISFRIKHTDEKTDKSSDHSDGEIHSPVEEEKSYMDDGLEVRCTETVTPGHWFIIDPRSRGKISWDMFSLLIVVCDSILLPYEIAFVDESSFLNIWFWITTFFFLSDMIVNSITGYYDKADRLVQNPSKILIRYLKSWFIIDLVATVPWTFFASEIFTSFSEDSSSAKLTRFTKVAKLARFVRLYRIVKKLDTRRVFGRLELMIGPALWLQIIQLSKFLLLLLYFCHWNACIWWLIGQPGNDPDRKHWTIKVQRNIYLNEDGRQVETWFRWIDRPNSEAYAFCLYWTLGVMRTMPSEVYPTNLEERWYLLVFMFIAFSLFAVCISKITSMFTKLLQARNQYDELTATVRQFMYTKNMPEQVQNKVHNYLDYLWSRSRLFGEDKAVMEPLSTDLKSRMLMSMYRSSLPNTPPFNNFPEHQLRRLLLLCTSHFFGVGEKLTQRGEVTHGAFFLVDGELVTEEGTSNLDCIPRKVVAADVDTLFVNRRTITSKYTIRVTKISEVLWLDKADFVALRLSCPQIEKFLTTHGDRGSIIGVSRLVHRARNQRNIPKTGHMEDTGAVAAAVCG